MLDSLETGHPYMDHLAGKIMKVSRRIAFFSKHRGSDCSSALKRGKDHDNMAEKIREKYRPSREIIRNELKEIEKANVEYLKEALDGLYLAMGLDSDDGLEEDSMASA